MKATEFVKKYGWKEAQICLLNCAMPQDKWFMRRGDLISGQDFDDLKQIVDAFELVETGLPELKKAMFSNSKDLDYVKNWILTVSDKLLTEKGARLKQAIELVEQCQ